MSKGILGLIPLLAIAALALARARGPMGGAFVALLMSQQFTTFTIPTLVVLLSERWFTVARGRPPSGAGNFGAGAAVSRLRDLPWDGRRAARICTTGAGSWRSIDGDPTDRPRAAVECFGRRLFFRAGFQEVRNFEAWLAALNCAALAPGRRFDPQNALLNLAALQAIANDAPSVGQEPAPSHRSANGCHKPLLVVGAGAGAGGTEGRSSHGGGGGFRPRRWKASRGKRDSGAAPDDHVLRLVRRASSMRVYSGGDSSELPS